MGTQPEHAAKEKLIDIHDGWMNRDVDLQPDGSVPKGLSLYNNCPPGGEKWYKDLFSVDDFANALLPMYCGPNLYFGDANPYRQETDSCAYPDMNPVVTLLTEGDDVSIAFDLGSTLDSVNCVNVTTDMRRRM